jgi:lysosomal Pro-X carboxypeptidase
LDINYLVYATSEQALRDLASFIEFIVKEEGLKQPKFVTIGCSYAGLLSERFRILFPNLINGAVAISVPSYPMLKLSLEYSAFAGSILQRFNPKCSSSFSDIFKELYDKLQTSSGRSEINKIIR